MHIPIHLSSASCGMLKAFLSFAEVHYMKDFLTLWEYLNEEISGKGWRKDTVYGRRLVVWLQIYVLPPLPFLVIFSLSVSLLFL